VSPRRWGRRRRDVQIHYTDYARLLASVSLAAVTLLLLVAVGGPWWQIVLTSAVSPGGGAIQGGTVTFTLRGAVSCSSFVTFPTNFTPCHFISAQQSFARGAINDMMNYAMIASVGAGALAWALATLGNLGVKFGRLQLTVEIALALFVVLAASGVLVAFTVLGPGAQANATCWNLSGGVTNCPGVWGSATPAPIAGVCLGCDVDMAWHAGGAYFEALLASGIGGLTVWYLWAGRQGPYTHEEEAAWSVRHRPLNRSLEELARIASAGAAARPPSDVVWTRPPTEATHPGFRIAERAWTCPNCGLENSRWAVVCSACHTDRPSE